MSAYTAGIDVGSTYTKAVVLGPDFAIAGRAMRPTGFQLSRVAHEVVAAALQAAGIAASDVAYTVATGFGRHHVTVGDVKVTDLTAAARCRCSPGPGRSWTWGGRTPRRSASRRRARFRTSA